MKLFSIVVFALLRAQLMDGPDGRADRADSAIPWYDPREPGEDGRKNSHQRMADPAVA